MAEQNQEKWFKIFTALFGLLAVSNLLKPFRFGSDETGFVFLGDRLSGMANTIVGPLFGLFLALYAFGIWQRKRFALPMGHAYATYVVLNLILFNVKNPRPPGVGYVIFGVVYSLIAIGVSLGAAYFLTKNKALLS
jgi:membrane-associated PAP2 superfamily phosphatase